MSIQFPENMEEVLMRQAQLKARGVEITEDDIIRKSVYEILQIFVDQETDGHYDEVKWAGEDLVIFDLDHSEIGRVRPNDGTFVSDFRANADQVMLKLESAAVENVGGR